MHGDAELKSVRRRLIPNPVGQVLIKADSLGASSFTPVYVSVPIDIDVVETGPQQALLLRE